MTEGTIMQEKWQFVDAGFGELVDVMHDICCCANSDLHVGCRPAST
jgi:hypothetical protein